MKVTSILGFIMQLVTLFTPYAIVIILGMYKPGVLRKSTCIISVAVNTVIMIVWMLIPETHIFDQVSYICVPVTLLTVIIVAILDKRRINEDYFKVIENKLI